MAADTANQGQNAELLALRRIDETSIKLQKQGKYLEALECMERGLVLRQHFFGSNSEEVWSACKTVGEMCNLLAMTYLQQEDFPMVLELLKKAEILTERDERGKAVTFNNLACYYRRQGKLHAALTYLQKAVRLEHHLINVENKADTHLNLCAVLSQLGRHAGALEHAQSALIMLQEELFSNPTILASGEAVTKADRVAVLSIAYHNIGVEQEFLRKYEMSLQSYSKGVEISEKYLGTNHGITVTLRNSQISAKRTVLAKMAKRDKTTYVSQRNGKKKRGKRSPKYSPTLKDEQRWKTIKSAYGDIPGVPDIRATPVPDVDSYQVVDILGSNEETEMAQMNESAEIEESGLMQKSFKEEKTNVDNNVNDDEITMKQLEMITPRVGTENSPEKSMDKEDVIKNEAKVDEKEENEAKENEVDGTGGEEKTFSIKQTAGEDEDTTSSKPISPKQSESVNEQKQDNSSEDNKEESKQVDALELDSSTLVFQQQSVIADTDEQSTLNKGEITVNEPSPPEITTVVEEPAETKPKLTESKAEESVIDTTVPESKSADVQEITQSIVEVHPIEEPSKREKKLPENESKLNDDQQDEIWQQVSPPAVESKLSDPETKVPDDENKVEENVDESKPTEEKIPDDANRSQQVVDEEVIVEAAQEDQILEQVPNEVPTESKEEEEGQIIKDVQPVEEKVEVEEKVDNKMEEKVDEQKQEETPKEMVEPSEAKLEEDGAKEPVVVIGEIPQEKNVEQEKPIEQSDEPENIGDESQEISKIVEVSQNVVGEDEQQTVEPPVEAVVVDEETQKKEGNNNTIEST